MHYFADQQAAQKVARFEGEGLRNCKLATLALVCMCKMQFLHIVETQRTSSPSRLIRGAVTNARLRVRSCLGLVMLCRMMVSPESTDLTFASRVDMTAAADGKTGNWGVFWGVFWGVKEERKMYGMG